ncbi:MAG: hypothetical protein RIF46_06335, partial [Cyclobacteriaceae bacterium]
MNLLSESEFNSITINGVSIEDIKLTNGQPEAIENLFKSSVAYSVKNEPASGISYLIGDGLALYFQDESGNGTFKILSIATNCTDDIFIIKGVSLSLGSDIFSLKKALGIRHTTIEGTGFNKIGFTTA